MLNKELFASRLRTLRQNNGISTRSLAAAIGLKSHGAIAQFEKGTSLPAIDTLVKLAEYFNVTLDYLVGVSDIPYPITNHENISETEELKDHMMSSKLEHKAEELIAGLDEESMLELHKFLRYLHARQTLDGDNETSCGLDIEEEGNLKEVKSS